MAEYLLTECGKDQLVTDEQGCFRGRKGCTNQVFVIRHVSLRKAPDSEVSPIGLEMCSTVLTSI